MSFAETVHQIDDKLCCGPHGVLIAIVSVDKRHEVTCLQAHLRALIVACWRTYPTRVVTIHRQTSNVEHATTDTLVRLTLTSHAERERVAVKLVAIEATNAVAIFYACKVYQVHERVYLIKLLALQHAANESLRRRTVARRILAASLIDAACGSNGADVFQRFGRQRLAKLLAKLIDKLPQLLRIFAVLNIGLYTSSHKRGTNRLYLVFYKYFHCSKFKRFC